MSRIEPRAQRLLDDQLDRVGYGQCSRHVIHVNKADARRTLRAHLRDVAQGWVRCWKCHSGRIAEVFACASGSRRHYHWGHRS